MRTTPERDGSYVNAFRMPSRLSENPLKPLTKPKRKQGRTATESRAETKGKTDLKPKRKHN